MFTLETKDYKLVFEYDTLEELEKYLELSTKNMEKIEEAKYRYSYVQHELEKAEAKKPTDDKPFTFQELETIFVANKRKIEKVGDSSYKQYRAMFNKAKAYFGKTDINTITIQDFEEYREHLKEDYELANKTINNHMSYVNNALEFAVNYKHIKENNVKGIETLKEEEVQKELFTDEDIKNIFAYEYDKNIKNIFILGAFTGMRVSEIINLKAEDIKEEDGIHYFNITKSKTKNGVRKVPIHTAIEYDVLNNMSFPLLTEKSQNAAQKKILRELYKVIDKDSTKNFHTFRAKFINKLLNKNHRDLIVIQEIVGHAKSKESSMTADIYSKSFDLKLKKEIVDSLEYQLD